MLERFNVLNSEDDQNVDGIDYPILLNLNQIASIKAINIMYKGNIIRGFWVRMVSGKKYKATKIPVALESSLNDEQELSSIEVNGTKLSAGESQELSLH